MQSMTGYGRCLLCREGRELLIEIKTVNHRFLDIAFRLPKSLAFLEDPLRRGIISGGLCRGHVDVFVTYQNIREDARSVHVDTPLFLACAKACEQAKVAAPQARKASVAEMLSLCGALTIVENEEDMAAVIRLAEDAAEGALAGLMDMRRREGEALLADLLERLESLRQLTEAIAIRAPEVPQRYRERLNARLQEWDVQGVDPQRLMQEVALMADRAAVDEELSRLQSHMAQFREGLAMDGEIGRRLDFLLQEMNREANTIGSKASDEEVAKHVVDAKCVLEKLREQVQNVV
jgi:uncharacterized protein (TIGR00255 family)